MLRNFFTIALRNFRHYRGYTLINIAGLALGISCALLIFLLVRFHLSTDTYHTKADRIYRVVTDLHLGGLVQTPGVPYPFGPALRQDFPELENIALLRNEHNNLITVPAAGDKPRQKFLMERELSYADPGFFETFDYQWLKGNPSVLKAPFTAVLTAPMAQRLFGDINPIGQTFQLENKYDFKVVGLLAKPKPNTEFHTEVFLSYASYFTVHPNESKDHWSGVSGNHHCYVTLPPGMQPEQINARFPAFVKKYQKEYEKWEHRLQPLAEMYFDVNYGGDVPKVLMYVLCFVGLLLIGTACVNFINLATAQALNRSREVGVRKVLGSSRWQLFYQFLFETGLITLLALLFSIILTVQALPYINELTRSELAIDFLHDPTLLVFLGILLVGVSLFAGAYPALVLAGFKPVQALKGKITTQTLGGYSVRRSLVVVQFVICQILIIAAIVITRQMDYMKQASLGFQKDAIVMLPVPHPEQSKMEALRQKLLQLPGVQKLSFGFDAPAGDSHNTSNCRYDTHQEDEQWYINTRPADDQYLNTYGIELVAGRNLQPSDTIREYLVNEMVAEKLGLSDPKELLGKPFRVWDQTAPIVGVVKNFHTKSMQEPLEPVVLMSSRKDFASCGVKIDLANSKKTLAEIDRIWNAIYPDDFFSYAFLDDKIAKFYILENALLGLAQGFCGIALFIGCLGLLGLVSFMAARRRKEIGIRKVLGATIPQILGLFGKEFVRLILIAFVIAAPVGWWAMTSWLDDYPYRIALGGGVFIATIGLSLLIAFLTVSAQSLHAALADPVGSLRSD